MCFMFRVELGKRRHYHTICMSFWITLLAWIFADWIKWHQAVALLRLRPQVCGTFSMPLWHSRNGRCLLQADSHSMSQGMYVLYYSIISCILRSLVILAYSSYLWKVHVVRFRDFKHKCTYHMKGRAMVEGCIWGTSQAFPFTRLFYTWTFWAE